MSNTGMKQVRVDNWGSYFLQRIKHFFNRTDYCDLTLQFQDNAQLKVHRLVLNACTEYFELLERTCEMYEDCLIMPDDLQADVVLPIINFMYTGLLDYEPILYQRLYSTAQIMNMHVLTKLLESQCPATSSALSQHLRVSTPTHISHASQISQTTHITPSAQTSIHGHKKVYTKRTGPGNALQPTYTRYRDPPKAYRPKHAPNPPRPTRYELPDDVDPDDFESSFADLSYETKPLKHPQFSKPKQEKDSYKTPVLFDEVSEQAGSSSEKFEELQRIMKRPSTSSNFSSQAKRIQLSRQSIYREPPQEDLLDAVEDNRHRPNERTTEIKVGLSNTGESSNVDHAKIISEVLKQYPHLVKNSKNIKLKILNPAIKNEMGDAMPKRSPVQTQPLIKKPSNLWYERTIKQEVDDSPEVSYNVPNVMDTREVSRLAALGADNIKGPWLCLTCGTRGQALNFPSYRKYRGHLIDVHKMRLSHNQCEFCGLKSGKRNHLLHHLYTKHGVPPPRNYSFPKCNQCDYIALTQAFLVKHKNSHVRQTRMYPQQINKINKCVYCLRVFQRESNLHSHMKITHRLAATRDGLLENSDDEDMELEGNYSMKYEELEVAKATIPEHVQIHTQANGNIQIIRNVDRATSKPAPPVQKILNAGLCGDTSPAKHYTTPKRMNISREIEDANSHSTTNENGKLHDRVVILNDKEYLLTAEEVHEAETVDDNAVEENGDQYILSDLDQYSQERHTLNFTMPQESEQQVHAIGNTQAQSIALPPKIIKRQIKPLVQESPEQMQVMDQQQYKALVSSSSIIFGEDSQRTAVSSMASSNSAVRASSASDIVILQDVTVSQAISGDNSNIVVVYSHAVDPNDKDYIPIDAAFLESHEAAQRASNAVVPVSQPQITRILTDQGVVQETVQVWPNPIEPVQQEASIVGETHSQITGLIEIPIDNSDSRISPPEQETVYQNETEMQEIQSEKNLTTEITQNDQVDINYESSIKQPNVEAELDTENSKEDVEATRVLEDPSMESNTVQMNYEVVDVQNSVTDGDATDMLTNDEEQIVHTEEIVTESTDSVEVEESIENIEQEVQKHIKQRQEQECEQSQDETETCSEMDVSDEIPDTIESVSVENTSKVNEAVKISLLTDWDETDLQSEVELVEIKDGDGAEAQDAETQDAEVVEENIVLEDTEQVQDLVQVQDKNKIEINTLVQDWDDEQDENET